MKVQFKDNIKGFKYCCEDGTIEEVYTEELNITEASGFNKYCSSQNIYYNIEDVVNDFDLFLNDDFDCVAEEIRGWGLDEVVEVIN